MTAKHWLYPIILTIVLLSGCSLFKRYSPDEDQMKVNTGMVMGAAAGSAASAVFGLSNPLGAVLGGAVVGTIVYKQTHPLPPEAVLHKELVRRGVKIVNVGEKFKLVVPDHTVFYAHSPNIQWPAYTTLRLIADYIDHCQPESVTINGYSDSVGDQTRNLALSRQRAINAADYLAAQALDTRLIYANGYGAAKPIIVRRFANRAMLNNRLEILWQRKSNLG